MNNFNNYEAFLRGDPLGFNLIYLTCRYPLIRFAESLVPRRDAAEDAVSDAFELLWKRRGTFESELHIKRFIYRVVINNCRTERRVLGRWFTKRTEKMEGIDIDALESKFLKELDSHNQWIVDKICIYLEQLPKQRREDFIDFIFNAKSYEDIARERGVVAGTVRVNVILIIKEIQNYLEDNDYPGYSKKS